MTKRRASPCPLAAESPIGREREFPVVRGKNLVKRKRKKERGIDTKRKRERESERGRGRQRNA